jgi:uncharacterized protein YuzE
MTKTQISIDKTQGLAYLQLSKEQVASTRSLTSTINIDMDVEGNLVGIEYLSLTTRFPKNAELLQSFHLDESDWEMITAGERVLS